MTPRIPPDAPPPGGRRLLWAVWILLASTAAAFIGVGWAVVDARDDASVRGGLDYEEFLSSVDELMQRAVGDTLVRFERIEGRIADGRTVLWDSLVVTADPSRYPSLQPGGFLRDQVEAYNRFQRERLAVGRERAEWFDRLAPWNPSVFRVGRDGDGALQLGRSGEAWSLRVRSPFEGRWGGEIRARDARRGAGLLGPGVAVSLRQPTRLFRSVDGRRQLCEFEPGGLRVDAFCLSEQRVPQATFRLVENDPTPRTAVAGWSDLWVDGRRVASGDSVSVREGSVLQLDPLEPMLLGEFWEGVLSREQWVNGRERRVADLPPPLDLFGPLERVGAGAVATASDAAVEVSIHAEASLDLTARLRDFVDDRVTLPVEGAMVVLARIPDGEIVAVAEVGRRSTPGRSALLEPVTPGSAVKPLLAAAALSRRPDLGALRIPARSGDVRSVLGLPAVPVSRAIESTLNCAIPVDGWIGLREAVRCSNNEFAASLVMASLFPRDAWRPVADVEIARPGRFQAGGRSWSGLRSEVGWPSRSGALDRTTLLTSDLAEGLFELFDRSPDPVISDRTRRSDAVWRGLRLTDGTPLTAPVAARPSVSTPLLLAAPDHADTEVGLLYRWAVGAWENRWTPLDLAEGFGRVVTDRRIGLRFSRAAATEPLPVAAGLGEGDGYAELLGGLRDVALDGTAAGLAGRWVGEGLPTGIFAKTGTLAEEAGGGAGEGLFVKSLLFAVGEEGTRAGAPLECGVVGTLYMRFEEGPARGSLPAFQIQFAEDELGEFLRSRWEEFGLCPGG